MKNERVLKAAKVACGINLMLLDFLRTCSLQKQSKCESCRPAPQNSYKSVGHVGAISRLSVSSFATCWGSMADVLGVGVGQVLEFRKLLKSADKRKWGGWGIK